MPLQHIVIDGKRYWRFGKFGHLYSGRDARAKARSQGAAIKISQSRRRMKSMLRRQ
jgi:hypothetical protein